MARRALLIANGRFADAGIPPLASPGADADDLRAVLERDEVGGYEVTVCRDAPSPQARIQVQKFFQEANYEDFLLLHISGHGIRDDDYGLHFATADTQLDMLFATSLEARFVIERMDRSRAAKKVAIIDTCHSGAFVAGMTAKTLSQGYSRSDFDAVDGATGRAIVTASTALQLAKEKEIDGRIRSHFTHHLIDGIVSGQADLDQDGMISLSDLFGYLSRQMKIEGIGQTPQLYDFGLAGQALIARNPVFDATRPRLAPPPFGPAREAAAAPRKMSPPLPSAWAPSEPAGAAPPDAKPAPAPAQRTDTRTKLRDWTIAALAVAAIPAVGIGAVLYSNYAEFQRKSQKFLADVDKSKYDMPEAERSKLEELFLKYDRENLQHYIENRIAGYHEENLTIDGYNYKFYVRPEAFVDNCFEGVSVYRTNGYDRPPKGSNEIEYTTQLCDR